MTTIYLTDIHIGNNLDEQFVYIIYHLINQKPEKQQKSINSWQFLSSLQLTNQTAN